MKKIRVLTPSALVIGNMTVDSYHPMDVWNEEVLMSDEVQRLLAEGKIEIVDDNS